MAPSLPGGPAGAWYYSESGQSLGPFATDAIREMLRTGRIQQITPVWREGMSAWTAAYKISDLTAGLSLPPPPPDLTTLSAAAPLPEDRKARQIIKNAKVNAITMFVLFVLFLAMLAAAGVSGLRGSRSFDPGCWGAACALGQLYALVYVPLRWRVLRSLPRPFSALGFIGGIGLIAELALMGLLLVAWPSLR